MSLQKISDLNYDRFEQMCVDTPEVLDKSKYTIIRIDGSNFHTFTKQCIKPYDVFLHCALDIAYHSAFDNILNKQWACFYSQSDEVTVVIPPVSSENQEMPYGKKSKLISLLPSYISSKFSQTLRLMFEYFDIYDKIEYYLEPIVNYLYDIGGMDLTKWDDYKIKFGVTMLKTAAFDARLFQTDSFQDVLDLLSWRRIDAITNSKSMYSHHHLGKKSVEGISNNERLELMVEKGFDWKALPTFIKRGNLMVNDLYAKKIDITDIGKYHYFGYYNPDEITKNYKTEYQKYRW